MGMSSDGDQLDPVMPTLKVVVRVWSMKCIVVLCPGWKVSIQPGGLKIAADVVIDLLLLSIVPALAQFQATLMNAIKWNEC